jgi:hypothetical protein
VAPSAPQRDRLQGSIPSLSHQPSFASVRRRCLIFPRPSYIFILKGCAFKSSQRQELHYQDRNRNDSYYIETGGGYPAVAGLLHVRLNLRQREGTEEEQVPLLAYPVSRKSVDDYEFFTGAQLNRLVDGAAKALINVGFEPVVCKHRIPTRIVGC